MLQSMKTSFDLYGGNTGGYNLQLHKLIPDLVYTIAHINSTENIFHVDKKDNSPALSLKRLLYFAFVEYSVDKLHGI